MVRVESLKVVSLVLCVALCAFFMTACGNLQAPAPTAPEGESATSVPSTGEVLQNAWPEDESIAYAPKFEGGTISKVSKQEGNQAKVYIISFDGIDQENYDAYAQLLEDDPNITVVTNFNTRDTSYALNAHKADDKSFEIRVTYTKPTQVMQIRITYA